MPTISDVGAVGFFADRVERLLADQAFETKVFRATRSSHFQPFRFLALRASLRTDRAPSEQLSLTSYVGGIAPCIHLAMLSPCWAAVQCE